MHYELIAWPEMLTRLAAAFLLGAVLGLERELERRPAGLRTHLLVCVASCLFGMLSLVTAGTENDPGRIAAQVVTGIGFLGAGAIMRHGSTVRGLTTAATLWMAAAIGLTLGLGWYPAAIVATVLALLALTVIKVLETYIPGPQHTVNLLVVPRRGTAPLPEVMATLQSLAVQLESIQFAAADDDGHKPMLLQLSLPAGLPGETVAAALQALPEVEDIMPGR